MRKITIIGLMILVASQIAIAQVKFEKYDNVYFKKEYDIMISKKATQEDFSLYILSASLDNLWKEGGIIIETKRYDKFIEALNSAKQKFSEWIVTAKENKVNELVKPMPITARCEGFFKTGEWHFQKVVNLTFEYKIIPKETTESEHLLILRTGKLQSSTNQFSDMDGFVLVFTSVQEIENFINKISKNNINTFLNKPSQDNLFK